MPLVYSTQCVYIDTLNVCIAETDVKNSINKKTVSFVAFCVENAGKRLTMVNVSNADMII